MVVEEFEKYKRNGRNIKMLVPAVSKKIELEQLFAKHLYDKDMFLYNGYPYCNSIPDLTPKENSYKWAIVDNDKVIGFFTYLIDNCNSGVYSFGLYSFDKGNPIIGFDVYKKMKELIKNYCRIEWRMIVGNPVQKHYDKLCNRHNGYRIMLHNVVKDEDGVYRDVYIYEIVKEKPNV